MNAIISAFGQAINVKAEEQKMVGNLFLHHFFQGFGLALVFIVANSIFLAEHGVKELPYVYIISGILVLIVGRIYAWFEHHSRINKLLIAVVLSSTIILLFLWISGFLLEEALFAFILLSLFQVLYLLYNLEFWGLSALVFDVRQSKRLFGLISAGDVPAKMLGYLTVSVLAAYIPLHFLILLAGVTVAISVVFLLKILKSHDLEEGNTRDLHHQFQKEGFTTHPMRYLKAFFRSRFIIVAAILSFIVVITLAFINYAFLLEVKYQFKKDTELAAFFGLFFAIGQFITIFIKAFLSGRLIQLLGVKRSLLIPPLSIVLILIISFAIQLFDNNYRNLIYIYGFLMLISEIFNYAIQQPLFLSLFQPLNAHLRLHGHTVIKGFVDGLGLIVAGLSLVLLIKLGTGNRLLGFGLIIFFIALIWTYWTGILEKYYFKLLHEAIRIRRFSGKSVFVKDERLLEHIIHKIEHGRSWETIYNLKALNEIDNQLFLNFAKNGLDHKKHEVRTWTLQQMHEEYFEERLPELKAKIESGLRKGNPDTVLLKKIIAIDPEAYKWGSRILEHDDHKVRQAGIEGLLKGKSIEGMVLAGNKLIQLKASNNINDKLSTCSIIQNLKLINFDQQISKHLSDNDLSVVKQAILTTCSLKILKLLPKVLDHFNTFKMKPWYLEALAQFGDDLMPLINEQLSNDKKASQSLRSVQFIMEHIKSDGAYAYLMEDLFLEESENRQKSLEIISGSSTFNPGSKLKEKAIIWLEKEIEMLAFLNDFNPGEAYTNLSKLEINRTIQRIFNLLHIIYPNARLPVLREAYYSIYANKKANALETLERVISKKIASRIIPHLEQNTSLPNNTEIEANQLLQRGLEFFSPWTIAALIQQAENISPDNLNKWSKSIHLVISQQANYHITKNKTNKKMYQQEEKLLELEKVSLLKNTELFRETPENLLVDLAGIIKEVRLNKGEILFKEGDPGDSMFIVHSGKLEILDNNKKLAEFSSLDFFGELSLLDDEPRSATARAIEESLLLSITQDDFFELISFRLEVAKSVLRVLAQRLRRQNKS